jgi:Ni,Fe-hydrogenase III large subunit
LGDINGTRKKIDVHYSRCVIPIGPVYPALKEPVNIRVTLNKEVITDVDFDWATLTEE